MELNPELWTYYRYVCDTCRQVLTRNDPVIIVKGNHYCSKECKNPSK
jgi:hypothetical protein